MDFGLKAGALKVSANLPMRNEEDPVCDNDCCGDVAIAAERVHCRPG